jgi:NADH-quinone oxidoreductase subunit N
MTLSLADFGPIWMNLAVSCLILLVILLDSFLGEQSLKKTMGYVISASLAAISVVSFFETPEGPAFLGVYVADPWSLLLQRILLFTVTISTLGSIDHIARTVPRRQGEYYVLTLFSLLGMMLLAGAKDLVLLVVSFELMGIPLFILAALQKQDLPGRRSTLPAEAAMKFFVVGVVSTPLALFGAALLAGLSGTTDLALIVRSPWSPLMQLGMVFVLAGMGFKIGLVPFHMWVPDVYEATSTPFVAFLSTAPKVAGIAAISRIFLFGLDEWAEHWGPAVLALCAATLLLGNLWALSQRTTKRLLAYSGIGHVGYIMLGFLAVDTFGTSMVLFYLAAYSLTNLGAFLVVEAVTVDGGSDQLEDFNGLARRSPWLALSMLLFLLSLAGIPFVVGFWAKLYVFIAAWRAGYPWLVVIGALLAVAALFYYMQLARAMYMVKPTQNGRVVVAPALTAAILLSLAGVVGFGLYPAPLLDEAEGAATAAFHRSPVGP